MFTKRIETVKKYDFKTKGYTYPTKPVKDHRRETIEILKGVGQMALIGTAAKIVIPTMAVTVPFVLIAGKLAFAASNVANVAPEAVTVAVSEAAKSKIIHAFDPLIDLMVSLSLPISGVMLTGGALMILIGQKEIGFRLIMNSALGYCLVQMSPLFLNLLAGVGNAI